MSNTATGQPESSKAGDAGFGVSGAGLETRRTEDLEKLPEGRIHAIRTTILKALGADDFSSLRLLLPQYAKELETLLRNGTVNASRLQHLETEHTRFYEQLRASLLTNRIRVRLDLERVRAAQRYEGEADDVPLVAIQG